MIILANVTSAIKLVTVGATETLDVHASWMDILSGAVTPGALNTAVAAAGTYTIVPSPTTSTYRNLKAATLANKHATASVTITVQHFDGTTTVNLITYTILPGETLMYFDQDGWVVMDANGGLKTSASAGRSMKSSVLTSGTSFITGPGTNTIKVRLIGAGGQGGGCTIGSASISGAAGGGASGGYAEKTFAVTPNTAYAYAIGAGGSSSAAGASTGQAGGNTTFTVGGVTVTAFGGLGGIGCTSAASVTTLGGVGASISTNGDVNGGGEPGDPGFVLAVGVAVSGKGGSSQYGSGGNALKTQQTGAIATGLGAGGGGGCAIGAVAAVAGGVGTGGAVIVDEYS